MYVKIDGQWKCIEKFELKSSSTTIYIHTEDEEGSLEVYKCPPEINRLQTHQTAVRNRQFNPRRLGVCERRTHQLNASIRSISLAFTHKHTTQQN